MQHMTDIELYTEVMLAIVRRGDPADHAARQAAAAVDARRLKFPIIITTAELTARINGENTRMADPYFRGDWETALKDHL